MWRRIERTRRQRMSSSSSAWRRSGEGGSCSRGCSRSLSSSSSSSSCIRRTQLHVLFKISSRRVVLLLQIFLLCKRRRKIHESVEWSQLLGVLIKGKKHSSRSRLNGWSMKFSLLVLTKVCCICCCCCCCGCSSCGRVG